MSVKIGIEALSPSAPLPFPSPLHLIIFSVYRALSDPEVEAQWRKEATDNLKEMEAKNLWGVPCIGYKNVTVWGQDKIWAIEALLAAECVQVASRESGHSTSDNFEYTNQKALDVVKTQFSV